MNVTIEHPFCPYCSEVTNLYFRIINTLLFSKDENELRTSMESLKKETRLDEYFTFGYGAHHLWICQRKPSDKNKIFPHRIMMIQFCVIVKTCSDIFYTIGQKKCPMPSAKIRNYSHSHNLVSQ